MAKYEGDARAAPLDPRQVFVNGRLYWSKTTTMCTTCMHEDRPFYLKSKLDSDAVLECPVCDTVVHTKRALVTETK